MALQAVALVRFDWDFAKARDNRRKHGIAFAYAVLVFSDPYFAQIDEFDRYEYRYRIIGLIDGTTYVVVCADDDADPDTGETVIRIISAREATVREREEYEEGTL